jgi:hypothetical protein
VKIAANRALAVFLLILHLLCALGFPTGNLDSKMFFSLIFGTTAFVLLLAILNGSPNMMKIFAGFAAIAFILLWSCVLVAPKYVFGVLYEYGAHVMFVSIISSIQIGSAIFAFMAKDHMSKKDP